MIKAEIVADSLNEFGNRITTMLVTMPRYILAEFNTHRMFSRNTASSRAIPFAKMVKSVEENPFIPIAWQKEHKGMQGTEYITDLEHIKQCKQDWLEALHYQVTYAKRLNLGFGDGTDCVTKQICNRLLESFMWVTVLVTATEWENFFALRCPQYVHSNGEVYRSRRDYIIDNNFNVEHGKLSNVDDNLAWLSINKGQAEIHMMATAEAMWDAYNESTPKQLKAGEWHIPFEDRIDKDKIFDIWITEDNSELDSPEALQFMNDSVIKISTVMAARTSYTVVGEDQKPLSYERMLQIHDDLVNAKPAHASPMEHCAQSMSKEEYTTNNRNRNFYGFKQYREIINL